MQIFNMGQVPPVTFGAGRVAKVAKIVKSLNGGHLFIIADAVLAKLGVTERLTQDLAESGIPFELAAEVSGEPKEALVDDLCARVRNVDAKVIIGLGGGAAMDAAMLSKRGSAAGATGSTGGPG